MSFWIKIFKKLSYLSVIVQNTIVRLQIVRFLEKLSYGLFHILELRLKCCFAWYMFHWMAIHFLLITCHLKFLQCAAPFPKIVLWVQLKPLMNEVCFQWFVYGFIFSLKQWAYLKYERVIIYSQLYSNDKLASFSSPSLPALFL